MNLSRAKEDLIGNVFAFVFAAIWIATPYWVPRSYKSIREKLDASGWIEHSHDTPVWIGGNWLTAEYRVCKVHLMPMNYLPASAHLLCGENYAADDQLWPVDFINSISEHGFYGLMGSKWDAVEQYFHVLPVKYWGRIDRGDRTSFSWRCQREESGLVCKAIN